MDRNELARRIKEVAYLEGDFTLRSGKKSKYYLDKYRFETQPAILRSLAELFAEHISPTTTQIAGAELGGVSLAAATSLQVNLPFVIVRNAKKGYGTSNLFEGMLGSGDRILIVEDIATTGGQVIEAAQILEEAGAKVEKIVAVIDRLEGAQENIEAAGFGFAALFTSADLGVGQ